MAPRAAGALTILLVEDDPIDARAVELALWRSSAGMPQLVRVETLAEARTAVARDKFDVVLLDLGLPDGRGVDNLKQVLAVSAAAPVVVLTGLDDDRVATEAVRFGAQDYVVKDTLEPHGLETTIRFARERHRMARELEDARRAESELKDRFLSHVSHELRTPLMAVMQFTAILLDGIAGDLAPQQLEYLGIVQRNADQLKRMISTLMDATRAATGKLSVEPVLLAIEPVVAEAVGSLRCRAAEKRIALTAKVDEALPAVVADRARILQVLDNLLENAIKFTPDGGKVDVAVGRDRDTPGFLRVVVRDSGPGLAENLRERVFDRLFQAGEGRDTSRKGLGLGLHICREILNLHGARIWVESEPGAGCAFMFTVPVYSLADYVRRVAVVDGAIQGGIGLVGVHVMAREGAAQAKGVAGLLPAVRQVLADCMLRFSDHVLPAAAEAAERAVVFGLARTGASGAAAIADRVRAELQRSERLLGRGCTFLVATRHFELVPAADPETVVEKLARELESEMRAMEGRSR